MNSIFLHIRDLYKTVEKEIKTRTIKKDALPDDEDFKLIAEVVINSMSRNLNPNLRTSEGKFFNDLAEYVREKENSKPFMRTIPPISKGKSYHKINFRNIMKCSESSGTTNRFYRLFLPYK